jgi:hypothetical protein
MNESIDSELTSLCEEFLEFLNSQYKKGVISLSELNQLSEKKIEFLEYIRDEK